MLEKLFKVNAHPEPMMIAEEINSAEFTAVKPDKLTNVTNTLVSDKLPTKFSSIIFFKRIKNHLFVIKIDNIRCNKSIVLIHIMI